MSMVMVKNMLTDHKAMHHNRRRMDAQVDAALRSKCGDNYQPPDEEDDMGITLLNSPVIGDDALKKLAAMVSANANATADANASSPAPAPVSSPASQAKKSLLQKVLPYALGATLSAGTAAAATWYLSPKDTDTNSQYDISAVEYEPPSTTPTEPTG